MCLTFIIFQSILKRWGYSWDRISWKGRLVVGLISLCMFVVPIKILHMKWMRMREERLFEEKLHQAEIDREQEYISYDLGNKNHLDKYCGCRNIAAASLGLNINIQNTKINSKVINATTSTCSESATARGERQRVISFSFFKKHSKKGKFSHSSLSSTEEEFKGILRNLELVEKYYSDYIMRLYTDITEEDDSSKHSALCDIYCNHPKLDICDVHNLESYSDISSYYGMLWRYAPMADPLVTEWHSRDLGSQITVREVSAVAEWLSLDKGYHVMRDHPSHHKTIQGCCFGMKVPEDDVESSTNNLIIQDDNKHSSIKTIKQTWKELFEKMLVHSMRKWKSGLDQDLVEKFIWPHISSVVTDVKGKSRSSLLVHDSYSCIHFKDKQPPDVHRPFPTRRNENTINVNFVGQIVGKMGENKITLDEHGTCPMICRPQEHPDWILC